MIYYLAEYSDRDNSRNLSCSPAGTAKMDYIISLIKESENVPLTVISAARSKEKKGRQASETRQTDKIQKTYYRTVRGINSVVGLHADRVLGIIELVWYFLKNVRKGDTVVVYHEMYYLPWVDALHKLLKFKLIYEVEELYGFYADSEKLIKKEIRHISNADAFIYSTDMLNGYVNPNGKPYTVIHGVYLPKERTEKEPFSKQDGKLHCLYAGTFSPDKAGAYLALEAAGHLDENYCLHISGFGSQRDTEKLKEEIENRKKTMKCRVCFEGFLSDDEFSELLQRCDIGLCTQRKNERLDKICFQSKTLMYMANGLRAVSAETEVMKRSALNGYIQYYRADTGEAIAEAIRSVQPEKNFETESILKKLHRQSEKDLKALL